jgi:hypothetical protein
MFDEVYSENFVSLDDVQDVAYDPWEEIDRRLDQEDESEE